METFPTGNNPSLVVYDNSSNFVFPITGRDTSRAFGDYQYYMSFGGDQYFNLPATIDAIFGASGIYPQMGHVLSQPSFEAAGYTAMGQELKMLIDWNM